jgi:hypothetical protein
MTGKTGLVAGSVIVEAARNAESDMPENIFGHMEELREMMERRHVQLRASAVIESEAKATSP